MPGEMGEPHRAEADAHGIAALAGELLHDGVVDGSMRDSGYSNAVTHTDPSPTAMSPPGPGTPTSIVATTLLVAGSMRETIPSP